MSKSALKKISVYFVVASLLSIFELVPIPSAMAATPSILINPTSGVAGTLVTASGQINTTDGAFTIRWTHAFNFTGVAVGYNFTKSFNVPSTAGGNIVVELIDDSNRSRIAATTTFTLIARFSIHIDPLPLLRQLQEGNKTSIKINVTEGLPNTRYPANITVKDPANKTHSAVVLLTNTTTTGLGNGTALFPTAFGTGAHTNLTGTYFVSSNVTGEETEEFFVGLTDRTEYRRKETVRIQVAGYKPSEKVKVDIRTSASVSSFPQNVTSGSSGMVTLTWTVPVNATSGTYRLILANATAGGTIKTPADAQNFTVPGFACLIKTINLANETVESATIRVYNANATTTVLNEGLTNSSGWVLFNRDGGNYTFKAFFRNAEVGSLANKVITADTNLTLTLSLANFLATVRTEEDEGVPLINVALKENKTGTQLAGQTNATGMAAIRNLFTNRTYSVEATRYGLLFRNITLDVVPSPTSGWIFLNLTLMNQQLNVHTIDAKDESAFGVDIRVYEWVSGTSASVDSATTDVSGDVFFLLPFGRYILKAFKGDDFLSETIVDLDESTALTFDLTTLNVNVVVSVFDYFGGPLPNAEVKIERKIGQDFTLISTKFTDVAGAAQFVDMVGGESRVSVSLGGVLVAVNTQFLGAGSSEVAIRVAEYVSVVGYPLQTGAFALLVFILVLIIVVLVTARKRVMQVFRRPSKR